MSNEHSPLCSQLSQTSGECSQSIMLHSDVNAVIGGHREAFWGGGFRKATLCWVQQT